MKRALLVLSPLLISANGAPQLCPKAQAVPQTVTTPHSTYYSDDMPPVRFQANRQVTVKFSTQDEINGICGKAPCPNQITLVCQPAKLLILPNPCSYGARGDDYGKLVCHELGHLNGWPATHGE